MAALDNFRPEVWAAAILSNLHKVHVFAGFVNRDYEGDIASYGDTVKINNIGPISVYDYVKDTDLAHLDTLTDDQRTLVIDQAKYFNFQVDDIDQAQSRPKVFAEATMEAAYALADTSDQLLAAELFDGTASENVLTGITPSATNAYETLLELRTKLNRRNVPTAGRWCVVTPGFMGLLLNDNRFINYAASNDSEALRSGVTVGRAAGFAIAESNNCAVSSGDDVIQAGSPMGATFAEQINSVYAYRPEKRFGDALKGLHLYGAKVGRPKALAAAVLSTDPT